MRHLHGVIWTLIAVCFLALVGCAHDTNRAPSSSPELRSGTTTDGGFSPTTEEIIRRNHGGGRASYHDNQKLNLPQLQAPQLRAPASAPVLAGFAPVRGPNRTSALNVQSFYCWLTLAVAFIFALIYAVRRSNARPDDEEPKFRA